MVSQLELGELGEEGMLFVYPAGSSPVLAVIGSTPSGLIHLEARHCQGNRRAVPSTAWAGSQLAIRVRTRRLSARIPGIAQAGVLAR
jgi:hypothetical protein